MASSTATAEISYIIQRQEDHPGNPGWWRFSRPMFCVGTPPPFSDHIRVWYGSEDDANRAQAEWDQSHPNG